MRCLFAGYGLAFGAVLFVNTVGCGTSSDTVSVNGTISYRGEPFPTGSITFFPTAGRPIVASIADDGTYEAEMPPGDYTVAIMLGAQLPPGYKEGDPIPPPKIELPAEYSTRAKSTLTATVVAGQSEPIDFELK
jgi:hypothetical protein